MAGRVKRISVDEARKLIEDQHVFLLDVRQPEEYEEGHIPGAFLIPLPELPDRISELKGRDRIIAYCRSGRRSLAAARLIAGEMDAEVYSMDGGILAWEGAVATGKVDDLELLTKELKEPYEFLVLAYTLEEEAEDFYLRLSEDQTFSELREVFRMLSSVEGMHKEKISSVAKGISSDDRFKGCIEGRMPVSEAFDRILSMKDDAKSILEFCMQMEVNSLDLYRKIAKLLRGRFKEVFTGIVSDEKRHLKTLGDMISKSFSS